MSKAKPAPLPSGTVVGGYQVIKKLAAGGFGVVYLAEDDKRHLVALKEYLPASLAERAPGELTPRVKPDKQPLYRLGLKSFFEEGRSLAQISHPSVVSVLNFFRENETVYMVMNYLQGDTLQDFIVTARDLKRDKVFRESTIRSLFDEVLRGLRIVHQHKMLHLDIKPANVFITNDNKAVLLDFSFQPLAPILRQGSDFMTITVTEQGSSVHVMGRSEVALSLGNQVDINFTQRLDTLFQSEARGAGFLPDIATGTYSHPLNELLFQAEKINARERPFVIHLRAQKDLTAIDGVSNLARMEVVITGVGQ